MNLRRCSLPFSKNTRPHGKVNGCERYSILIFFNQSASFTRRTCFFAKHFTASFAVCTKLHWDRLSDWHQLRIKKCINVTLLKASITYILVDGTLFFHFLSGLFELVCRVLVNGRIMALVRTLKCFQRNTAFARKAVLVQLADNECNDCRNKHDV